MSLMTDVFVEMERLNQSLKKLRDELVVNDKMQHVELFEARRSCHKISEELRSIGSLLQGAERSDFERLMNAPPEPPKPPKGPFKLVVS